MNITDNQEKIKVTVSTQEKDGKYYAVLQYKDESGKKQYKWKATKIKAEKGNKKAILALKAYDLNIAQYIAKYAVSMGGVDIIVFTAGVGENQKNRRMGICNHLRFMGLELDAKKNEVRSEEKENEIILEVKKKNHQNTYIK